MLEKDKIDFYRVAQNVYFLKGLNLSEFKALKSYMTIAEYRAKDRILVQEFKSDALYFLHQGVCGVYKGCVDKDHLVDVKISGDCFGEISFFSEKKATASVVAHQNVTVMSLKKENFEELVNLHPRIGYIVYRNIFDTISRRFNNLPPFFSNLFLWGYKAKESIARNNVKNRIINVIKFIMFFIWISTIIIGGLAGKVLFDTHFHRYFPDTFTGRFIFIIVGMAFLSSILLCIWFLIDYGITRAIRAKNYCSKCRYFQNLDSGPLCMIRFIKNKSNPSPDKPVKCEFYEKSPE